MNRLPLLSLSILLPLGLAACVGGESNPDEPDTTRVVQLRAAFDASDVDVVGVTLRSDTGERYLLEANRGLYKLDVQGVLSLVLALEDFPPSEIAPVSAFTDIAHLGGERFALTAMNDGFLLDLEAMTLQRHFCYLPDDLPLEDVYQLTNSVAFDPMRQLIFAQPQTVSSLDGTVVASSLGNFASDSGEDLTWVDMSRPDYIAGGMAVTGFGELALGSGSTLDRFDVESGFVNGSTDLGRFGIEKISGLAADLNAGLLLVVDASDDTLHELPLSLFGDAFPQ